MRRYLLGELPEAEAATLEQAYFSDPQLVDQLVEVENELVDKYARGLLSPETRARFERHYLAHPNRRERAKFAEALTARLDRPVEMPAASPILIRSWRGRLLTSLQGPKLAWSFSLALLLLIAGVIWFAVDSRRLHQEVARNEAERAAQQQRERDLQQQLASERTRADQLASELDRVSSSRPTANPTPTPTGPATPAFATLVLNFSGVRGAESGPAAMLNIPSGTEEARIQLNLRDNEYSAYSVTVQSADGKQVFKQDGLRSRNKTRASLSVVIPANKLSNGDYILTLKGITSSGELEDVSKSLFRVSQNHPR